MTAFIARMPMAMYSLGTVLMITALHGDYALAGGISGLVIDRAGADGGYLAAAVCAVLAAAMCVAALPSLGSAAPRDEPGISVI